MQYVKQCLDAACVSRSRRYMSPDCKTLSDFIYSRLLFESCFIPRIAKRHDGMLPRWNLTRCTDTLLQSRGAALHHGNFTRTCFGMITHAFIAINIHLLSPRKQDGLLACPVLNAFVDLDPHAEHPYLCGQLSFNSLFLCNSKLEVSLAWPMLKSVAQHRTTLARPNIANASVQFLWQHISAVAAIAVLIL